MKADTRPWADEEVSNLVKWRVECVPREEIARRLGRSYAAVSSKIQYTDRGIDQGTMHITGGAKEYHEAWARMRQPKRQDKRGTESALPAGHPISWGLLTAGTCLEGQAYGALA